MKYRALFIGGPIDGQERVLADTRLLIMVRSQADWQSLPVDYTYNLLSIYGNGVLIYSVYSLEETMNRLWHHYTGGKYA